MTRIALLRGVNAGGAGRLPMADFRAILTDLDLGRPQTFIQSGNALFDSALPDAVLAKMIREAVQARGGFAPDVFMLTPPDLDRALDPDRFPGAAPEKVHAFFLAQEVQAPDTQALQALAAPGDGWHSDGALFLLHTPAGIGRSRLAARLDKVLPTPMTARNLRTVAALRALAAARDGTAPRLAEP